MNVLIVDDNPLMREMLRETVGAFAAQVEECGDGVGALAAYQCSQPDWVLMDWEMPIRDGISATLEILSEFPEAQICMVSAYSHAALRERALAAGARAFVCKDQLDALESILR
jgi:two-component system chemotaxis response regulator CheY